MVQLKFNDSFDDFIESIDYWKSVDEIPSKIKDFITTTSDSRIIYDENSNKYHCSKCLKELDENKVCESCNKVYKIDDYGNKKIINCVIKDIRDYQERVYYYFFDINGDDIFIYILKEYISYYNPLTPYPYKTSKVTIEKVYQVFSDKILDLINNKYFFYEEMAKSIEFYEHDEHDADAYLNSNLDTYYEFSLNRYEISFLFTDNLDELKNVNLYKYTGIWNLKDHLKKNSFCLTNLTIYPIYYKQFEYLIKMELYNLALTPDIIKYQHNFEDTFGVEKKYYEFMKKIDITPSQLYALQVYPTTDINILNFISNDIWLIKELSKYADIEKLKKYFEEQSLNINNLYEYYDYIRCCEEMKLNLKDSNVLFPKQFIQEHDKITRDMIITSDPKTNEKIKTLSSVLVLNKYEDDKYIIFPANSVETLVDESSQQSNCVRTYCNMVSNNECQVYFMRCKDNINQSFVTIEVRNGKIVQAKTKFNQEPNNEIMTILKKWEQQMTPVINPDENLEQ